MTTFELAAILLLDHGTVLHRLADSGIETTIRRYPYGNHHYAVLTTAEALELEQLLLPEAVELQERIPVLRG